MRWLDFPDLHIQAVTPSFLEDIGKGLIGSPSLLRPVLVDGWKPLEQRLNRDPGRLRIDSVQVRNPLLQYPFAKFSIGRPETVLFALASCPFYSIVRAVKLMTVETWNSWALGEQLPSAFPVL
jgi:hypothetical protein